MKEIIIGELEFIYIAKYINQDEKIVINVEPFIKKTERKSLVYILVVNEEIKYIGKTIQGYLRPLNYHKNDVMIDVRNGIKDTLSIHNSVEVYVYEKPIVEFKGLELDLAEAIEQALIKKYSPKWNNHIAK